MASLAELEGAFIQADKAGNTEDAKAFADEIFRMRSQQTPKETKEPPSPVVTEKPQQTMPWSEVAGQAISNLPQSIGGVVSGIVQTVAHPIKAVSGLMDIAAGELQKIVPKPVKEAISRFEFDPEAAARAEKAATNVNQFYSQRYGSKEGFKRALAEDPAGVAADMSSVLYGGAGLATKASLPGVSTAAAKAARAIDPLVGAAKVAGATTRGIGKATAHLGGLTTGAGSEALKEAFRAGRTGGESAKQFQEHLRGQAEFTDILPIVKKDLNSLKQERMTEYQKNMDAVRTDKSILDFSPLHKALQDAKDIYTYRGSSGLGHPVVKNKAAAEVAEKITDAIYGWEQLDPDFHTAEGFDQLKQVVGGIVDNIPDKERTALKVGTQMYNAIKNEVTNQAPTYAKTMKAYRDASETINEIEHALGANNKTKADTAMRKLQSIMRNNVSTNYGNRLKLARELQEKGTAQFMPAIAGQALSSGMPRGLQQITTVPQALAVGGVGGIPAAALSLATGSPRLMGEAAYYAGKMARGEKISRQAINNLADRFNTTPAEVGNILYQLRSRLEEQPSEQQSQKNAIPLSEGLNAGTIQ